MPYSFSTLAKQAKGLGKGIVRSLVVEARGLEKLVEGLADVQDLVIDPARVRRASGQWGSTRSRGSSRGPMGRSALAGVL